MLEVLSIAAQLLITAGLILLVAWLVIEGWRDLQIHQKEWEERRAKKKQAKLDFEEAKLNAGIKRGEE